MQLTFTYKITSNTDNSSVSKEQQLPTSGKCSSTALTYGWAKEIDSSPWTFVDNSIVPSLLRLSTHKMKIPIDDVLCFLVRVRWAIWYGEEDSGVSFSPGPPVQSLHSNSQGRPGANLYRDDLRCWWSVRAVQGPFTGIRDSVCLLSVVKNAFRQPFFQPPRRVNLRKGRSKLLPNAFFQNNNVYACQ